MKVEIILDLNEPIDPNNPCGCAYVVTRQPYRPSLTAGYKRYRVFAEIPGIRETPQVKGVVVEE